MKISEIIDNITSINPDLESALLQVKVIATRSNTLSIIEWLDNEISGYSEKSEIPPYRIISTIPMGYITNSKWKYEETPIPMKSLPDSIKSRLTTVHLDMSVSAIKNAISENSELTEPLPPEMCSMISSTLNNGFRILSGHKSVTQMDLSNVYSSIKRVLLDILLELEGKLDSDTMPTGTYTGEMMINTQAAIEAGMQKNMATFLGHGSLAK
jgi:hypothetical protein